MSRELALFRDFWDNVPSLSESDSMLFKDSREFSKILNGRCDFEETDDSYSIDLELPGVSRNEIDLQYKNDRLTVTWSRVREKRKGILSRSRFERSEGSFSRSFEVQGADPDTISANLKNGVLHITLPKQSGFKPKYIQIQ